MGRPVPSSQSLEDCAVQFVGYEPIIIYAPVVIGSSSGGEVYAMLLWSFFGAG